MTWIFFKVDFLNFFLHSHKKPEKSKMPIPTRRSRRAAAVIATRTRKHAQMIEDEYESDDIPSPEKPRSQRITAKWQSQKYGFPLYLAEFTRDDPNVSQFYVCRLW